MDAGCIQLLVFLALAAIGGMTEGRSFWGRSTRRRWYRDVEQSFPGTHATVARDVERDLVELPGPPCPARVRFYHHVLDGGRREYSEFLAEPDWRGGAMRVTTPEWRGGLEVYYGGRDLTIGTPEFDARYVIQANPAELARRYLDQPTQALIRRLDQLGDGAFLFQIRPRQILVRVSRRMREGIQLQRFIADCYALVTRITGLGEGSVSVQPIEIGQDADCQVCGVKIEMAQRVLCSKCRTPHHSDCWGYNDGCSIFACGERRSVRA